MAELTITTFLTLDGVMQAPGGPDEDTAGGFASGGWVVPHFDDATGAFIHDVYGRATAFLLGRGTYDIFASHWPHIDDPNDLVATQLNALPKFVATRTRDSLSWHNSTPVHDVVAKVRSLAQELVVVGPGKRLFGGGAVPAELKLVRSHATGAGIVISTYRREGALRTGTYGLEQ